MRLAPGEIKEELVGMFRTVSRIISQSYESLESVMTIILHYVYYGEGEMMSRWGQEMKDIFRHLLTHLKDEALPLVINVLQNTVVLFPELSVSLFHDFFVFLLSLSFDPSVCLPFFFSFFLSLSSFFSFCLNTDLFRPLFLSFYS